LSAFGSHAHKKTMVLFSFSLVGLERPFHNTALYLLALS
jgi:hypothetical protein